MALKILGRKNVGSRERTDTSPRQASRAQHVPLRFTFFGVLVLSLHRYQGRAHPVESGPQQCRVLQSETTFFGASVRDAQSRTFQQGDVSRISALMVEAGAYTEILRIFTTQKHRVEGLAIISPCHCK